MANERRIEVFSAGCPICQDVVDLVNEASCPSCEVVVHDMASPEAVARARELEVGSVPAVAIDGKLAGCCAGRRVDIDELRAAGLGHPH